MLPDISIDVSGKVLTWPDVATNIRRAMLCFFENENDSWLMVNSGRIEVEIQTIETFLKIVQGTMDIFDQIGGYVSLVFN